MWPAARAYPHCLSLILGHYPTTPNSPHTSSTKPEQSHPGLPCQIPTDTKEGVCPAERREQRRLEQCAWHTHGRPGSASQEILLLV